MRGCSARAWSRERLGRSEPTPPAFPTAPPGYPAAVAAATGRWKNFLSGLVSIPPGQVTAGLLLFPHGSGKVCSSRGKVVAVMLSVFGDENSDEARERVFAVAGVIGSEALWSPLEARWIARCGGVPFHAKDCDSDKGDFAKFTPKENKDRYRDLTVLLAESGLGGFGIALDVIGQEAVFPEAPGGMAFYKCFIEVIQKMKNCAAYNRETVKFTFDMRPESEHNTGILYAMAKRSKQWNPYLDSEIGFACSRDHP